jgi:glycosyltransferase involved in cell wall biosynthesis
MSGINSELKLIIKKIECFFSKNKPDIFIFESEAMRKTATHGRGISHQKTEVIHLGVDIKIFSPCYGNDFYTHDSIGIPRNRKIVFYSGHMEERKGVRIIINAAIEIIENQHFTNIHFVICGNKFNEADKFLSLVENSKAKDHITFAGYRNDIPNLMRGSHIGVIASTGWDSFTMSSVEMMASGLPLIVSNLQGLSETVSENENGYLISPGSHTDLANRIVEIATNEELAKKFSRASRKRAETYFSKKLQIAKLSHLFHLSRE